MECYPLKFKPILLEKVWGGRLIADVFPGKGADPDQPIGESWELAAREDHDSEIVNGLYTGRTINDLLAEYGTELVGTHGLDSHAARFPLLFKFIDAADDLSIQVHPDDAYALEHENDLGKMEAWYIVHAEADAKIIKGLKAGYDRERFKEAIVSGSVPASLNMFGAQAGDVVFLPPKTMHAIGKGLLLFEVQQNSDVTYRAYDWDRVGLDGQPRELHTEQVYAVTDFNPPERDKEREGPGQAMNTCSTLIDCRYFILDEARIDRPAALTAPEDRFLVIAAVDGEGVFTDSGETIEAGETVLLPAGYRDTLKPQGVMTVLGITVPPVHTWYEMDAE